VAHHPHLPDLEDEDEQDESRAAAPDTPPPSEKIETAPAPASKHRSNWLLRVGVEVLLITLGVFLALMGEQWRENGQNRELAEDALRRLRAEIQMNQKAVADVREYHATMLSSLRAYLASDDRAKAALSVHLEGIRPVFFENTAWELALATESLVHMDQDVAYSISHIYGLQRRYEGLSGGVTNAMYLVTPSSREAFFPAVAVFYEDIVIFEPELLRLYGEVLPQIDRALGNSPVTQ
jgi:hypothetical protein